MPDRSDKPRVSFVLVVHREQAWIEQCATSLLAQAGADVELIAIDDASPDHAPAVLDELADADSRVRVEHLAARVGLGPARNIGLEMARGDYVWFVNATDSLPRGALPVVVNAVQAGPDLVVLHHERTDALGQISQGSRRGVLSRVADRPVGSLDASPGLAAFAPHAWNKVFRREFLAGLGVAFGPGEHGELPVTWPALLSAERIAAVPQVAYHRRRPANAPREGSAFDVFARYEDAFGSAGSHGARQALMPAAMLRHELALLDRVPPDRRRDFFNRIADALRRHRQPTDPLPDGAKERAVASGSYLRFRAVERAQAVRQSLARRRGRLAQRVRRAGLRRHYRAQLRRPIDENLAVFAAYWYRGYSCNPGAIHERARELVPSMRAVWVVKPEGVDSLPAGVEHVLPGTREYYEVMARARYFVNNVNFPNDIVKRPGTTHVMTHHGTPLKKMGLDLADAAPTGGARNDFAALVRRCARWDFSISQNAFSTLVWERVYPTRYESLEVGYPRNDALARARDDDARRIRAELGIDPERRVVLYAPTHREYQRDSVPPLDIAALADGLGPGYTIMARLHYFYGSDPELRALHDAGRILDVASHPSVEQLCIASDALITDYSSIMFDYGVLDRPIVIHAPDWETYKAMRGTYFDLLEEPPGPVARTAAEVVGALRSGVAWDDESRAARAAFRARFCSLDDGHAAERVVRRVWFGEQQPAVQRPPAVVG